MFLKYGHDVGSAWPNRQGRQVHTNNLKTNRWYWNGPLHFYGFRRQGTARWHPANQWVFCRSMIFRTRLRAVAKISKADFGASAPVRDCCRFGEDREMHFRTVLGHRG